MNTIGTEEPRKRSRSRSSNPFNPGRRRSTMRQSASVPCASYSSADANTRTSCPIARRRRRSAVRTASSSSTMASLKGSASVMASQGFRPRMPTNGSAWGRLEQGRRPYSTQLYVARNGVQRARERRSATVTHRPRRISRLTDVIYSCKTTPVDHPGAPMPERHDLTELQLSILRLLWQREEATVAELWEALYDERRLAQTTVATLVARLQRRGIVARRTRDRQFLYRATITEADVRHSMVSELTERLFAGDRTELVNHLVSASDMSPGDLARLKQILRNAQATKGDSK